MAEKKYMTTPPDTDRMPPGIPYIIGNEAAERFSFYGMKTILAIFMTQYLLDAQRNPDPMTTEQASEVVHYFVSSVYFVPILGALLSDWLLGKYHTILWLSLVYCAGHAVLALMDVPLGIHQKYLLYIGLALIAVGSGGIKPCVSANVGDQFGKRNKHLISRVFGWFYFSINFGSFFSTLLTPYLREKYGPSVAFGVPGILMGLATLIFWMGRNKFVHIPPSGNRFFRETFTGDGLRAVLNLVPLYLLVLMFWCLFDQTGSRWVLQAEHMDKVVANTAGTPLEGVVNWFKGADSRSGSGVIELTSDQIQAVNPLLVMALIPLFNYVLYPLLGLFFTVTPLRKIGIGMFLTLPSFIIPAWLETQIQAGITPHISWQILAYVFLTAAEVMVSITCLEFSYTQAPTKMKSVIMGLYLLSVALGNLFAGQVNGYIDRQMSAGNPILQGADYYWFFTGCMAVAAVLFVIWSRFYRGRTYVQGEEGTEPDSP